MLRHTKVDTWQEQYVQPMQESVRGTVDKLASLLLPESKLLPKKPSTDTVGRQDSSHGSAFAAFWSFGVDPGGKVSRPMGSQAH